MYRIPEDPKFSLRTTSLRTATGWEQFEDRVPWAQQVPRTPKFTVWGDRGVFEFLPRTRELSQARFRIMRYMTL